MGLGMRGYRLWAGAILFCLVGFALAGCSTSAANMAATQPEWINLDVLREGTPRALVVARLGAPLSTVREGTPPNFRTTEVYKFIQGFSAIGRTSRVFVHSTLSVATLGLWEATGQALEGYARGTRVSIEVVYDESDRLLVYCVLEGRDADLGDVSKTAVSPTCESTKAAA